MAAPQPVFANSEYDLQFQQQGFIVVPLLTESEITSLRELWSTLRYAMPGDFYATVFNSDPGYRRAVIEGVGSVLSPKVKKLIPGYRTTLEAFIVKRARSQRGMIAMHQDYTLVDPDKHTAVNVWCPLLDVDVSTGCLYFVGGSHSFTDHISAVPRGVWQGYPMVPNPTPWEPVKDRLYKECSTPVPLKAGHGVFWHHRALHWSPENQTDSERIIVGCMCLPEEADMRLHYWDWENPGSLELVDVHGTLDVPMGEVPGVRPPYPPSWTEAGFVEYDRTPFTNEQIEPLVCR